MFSARRQKVIERGAEGICMLPRLNLGRLLSGAIVVLVMLLGATPITLATAPSDRAGAALMSVGVLLATPEKFDGKHVWAFGILKVKDGVPYLSVDSTPNIPDAGVCLDGTDALDPGSPLPLETLKQLRDLPLGVHGVYRRSTQGDLKNCRNGTIRVVLVEISFV